MFKAMNQYHTKPKTVKVKSTAKHIHISLLIHI